MKKIIFALTGLYFLLALCAAILPGVIGKSQEGLAAGTTAAVTFFGFGGLAAIISAVLFRLVMKRYRDLDRVSIFIGILPSVITFFAALGLYVIATVS